MAHELVVFDAYGTLFDVHAAAAAEQAVIGATWERLSQLWRTKHLEYTWIHAQTRRPVSFWTLTQRSLDHAIASVGGVPVDVRGRLLAAYRTMQPFVEVPSVLAALKARGAKLAILSNGDPDMLDDAVAAAGFGGLFDAVLSVAAAGTFKPDASVYEMVTDRFGCKAADVVFLSANRWDIAGGHTFGFRTAWVNRAGVPDEYPDMPADRTIGSLQPLLASV